MRLRRRRSPLPFLLLPLLVLAVTVVAKEHESDGSVSDQPAPKQEEPPVAPPLDAPTTPLNAKSKQDVGTKDAPVDGKDGKPHAGPWVEAGSENAKAKANSEGEGKEPLPGKKPSPRPMTGAAGAAIPEVNDGVMDDPTREGPKKGMTGTEGGVSEKTRDRKAQEGQTGGKTEKKPDPPKEAPPLPHSEEEKIRETEGDKKDGGNPDQVVGDPDHKPVIEETLGGLAKPLDLPPKTHDTLPPAPASSKKDPLHPIDAGSTTTDARVPGVPVLGDPNSLIQPFHSLVLSLTMILFSEIGDKTFLIAALMAMKHPRLLVFSAAFAALIAMTILSAVLGHAVPTLIPKRFTNVLAAVLFLVFGAKMLREGFQMRPEENVSQEMKEVEMELEEREQLALKQGRRGRSSVSPYILEAGRATGPRKARPNSRLPSPPRSPSSSRSRSPSPQPTLSTVKNLLAGLNNLFSLLLSPAWVQTFVMTFLGEWGDRSQIATIAMAAGQDYWWVTVGAVVGHAMCTAVAVLGGRAIAGRVSLKVVTLGGAFAFLSFSLIYFAEALYYP